MNSQRQYFLANGIPNQPVADIRCYIVTDGPVMVLIRCADIRLSSCPESLSLRSNLTPISDEGTATVVSHKTGLVSFG